MEAETLDIKDFKNIEDLGEQRYHTASVLQYRKWRCTECGKRFTKASQAKNHKCSTKYYK